jgi:hypothetical protein
MRGAPRMAVAGYGMSLQAEDDDLDEYETWARARLAPLLGPLRRVDRRGGPEGLHDFEADLADGSVAAVEVTGEVDAQRRSLAAAAERRLASVTLPGSNSLWLVGLAATARVSAIRRPELRRLLGDLEACGRRRVHDLGDYRDPFVARLVALGVESAYAVKANAGHQGTALVGPGTYGGWDGTARPSTGGLASCWSPTGAPTSWASSVALKPPSGTWSSCSTRSARQAWAARWG